MRQMSMKLITIVQKKPGMRWLKKTSQQNLKKENTHDTNENTYQREGDKDDHLTQMQQRPMEEDMNQNRRNAVLVGAMYLISTETLCVSNALITSHLSFN